MAVSNVYIIFFNSQKSFSFLSNAPHIIKLKSYEIKNTVRVPSRMQLTKNPVFLHYYSKFMGILLFVLKYMYFSFLLNMINGFSWPTKIMASPFKHRCKFTYLKNKQTKQNNFFSFKSEFSQKGAFSFKYIVLCILQYNMPLNHILVEPWGPLLLVEHDLTGGNMALKEFKCTAVGWYGFKIQSFFWFIGSVGCWRLCQHLSWTLVVKFCYFKLPDTVHPFLVFITKGSYPVLWDLVILVWMWVQTTDQDDSLLFLISLWPFFNMAVYSSSDTWDLRLYITMWRYMSSSICTVWRRNGIAGKIFLSQFDQQAHIYCSFCRKIKIKLYEAPESAGSNPCTWAWNYLRAEIWWTVSALDLLTYLFDTIGDLQLFYIVWVSKFDYVTVMIRWIVICI